jgi:hypothetical protein
LAALSHYGSMPMWWFTASTNPLFAAKIALSGLHGDMSEQELNLL